MQAERWNALAPQAAALPPLKAVSGAVHADTLSRFRGRWSIFMRIKSDFLRFAAPIVLLGVALQPRPAEAWDRVGHQAIADMAEQQVTPATWRKIAALLSIEGDRHLSEIANWADVQKEQHPGEGPSHSVRLPLQGSDFTPNACPTGFCATTAIEHYESVLADPSAAAADKLVALKYVVHLIGDVHQPLHAVERTGAGQPVFMNGQLTTLHKVWDLAFVPKNIPAQEVAKMAQQQAGPQAGGGTPEDWALESRAIARDRIYADIPKHVRSAINLPDDYASAEWPIAAQRMVQAGTRLAQALNAAFGDRTAAAAPVAEGPANSTRPTEMASAPCVPANAAGLRSLIEMVLFSPSNAVASAGNKNCIS